MKRITVSKSFVGRAEADAISKIIFEDGYLGMGREVERFETELGEFLGVPREQVACVSSGTSALHLALATLLKPGDEVLVQSLTFVGTFQAISAAGAVPIPCEVSPETLTLDLRHAEKRCSSRTRALIPVHYAGFPGDLDAIYAFAKARGLRVVEDAAHAFGCKHHGRLIGSIGDVTCFSFDGIKNITSGEGGAVLCSDREVMRRVKHSRLLGVERDLERPYGTDRSSDFDVPRQGYRYHMSNILAAVGRMQLKRFAEELAPPRVALATVYREQLSDIPEIQLFSTDLGPVIPHIQPIRIKAGRDRLRQHLAAKGIETAVHYKPNHLLTYYRQANCSLPTTEHLYRELLSLPLHPEMSADEVRWICGEIRSWIRNQ